jgi:hypothetical protein
MITFDEMARLRWIANLAAARKQQQGERRWRRFLLLLSFWPGAAGFLLACVAPQLSDLLAPFHPWGMRLVFPLVVLAGRPEVCMGETMARILPHVLLYAQFPLEGLLVRIVLRSQVTLSAVTGRMCFYHFLGATHLLLLTGVLAQYEARFPVLQWLDPETVMTNWPLR